MTHDDTKWIRKLLYEKVLKGPVLELGVGYGGDTCREMIVAAGLSYFGTDLEKTPSVDFVADFDRSEDMKIFSSCDPFGTILILNVLEHTFAPIRILDHAISLLKPGGQCVLIAPAIWPLHNFPMDAWRILPNFYEAYARRRQLNLNPDYFDYVGKGSVDQFRDENGNYQFPPPSPHPLHMLWSRAIHKGFQTFGRNMFQPSHIGIGAILQKPLV